MLANDTVGFNDIFVNLLVNYTTAGQKIYDYFDFLSHLEVESERSCELNLNQNKTLPPLHVDGLN